MLDGITTVLWIGPPVVFIVASNLIFGTDPGPRHIMRLLLVISAVEIVIWLVWVLVSGDRFHWFIVGQWGLMGGFALWNLRRMPPSPN